MRQSPVRDAGSGQRRSAAERGGAARLESLTGLRWFATFGVFLSHVDILLPLPHTRGLFSLGESGVSLFFVLSGFVLAWNWSPDHGAGAFYGRRFARVWPLLAVAVALPTVFAATSKGGPAVPHLLLISASAVLLVQAWVPGWILLGASPVTWSLSCEAFFYGLFPGLMRRLAGASAARLAVLAGTAVAALWGVRIGLWLAYPPVRHVTSLDGYGPAVFCVYSPLARLPQFLIGMATAVAVRRGLRLPSVRVAVAALLVPVTALWLLRGCAFRGAVLFDASDVALTPFFALLIAALARRDLAGGRSFLRSRPLVRLGQWSYAFYLFQFTVLLPMALAASPGRQVADFFTDPVRPGLGHLGYAVAALAITLGVSAFCYRFVEHPLERRLRRRFGSGPRAGWAWSPPDPAVSRK
ncbi:acyltransferase family protein [Actinacidiphila acididurans]|uniref:Acyltransferase n=1 Tax=Actinacidiphila acididurans TaxID=2784346 RepID=A0ABS2TXW3_9ACTN|nr:acyltransferase [Actinacidiphila acididurans]MBM9508185.1 acyltransferase [Actinacidiphila acididurans]